MITSESVTAAHQVSVMNWVQRTPDGPRFYVAPDCMVWGQTQSFFQHGGGGTGVHTGFQAYFEGKEVGRFVTESLARECVEAAYARKQRT